MPPTGQKVNFRAISWFRIKDGRMAEEWTQLKSSRESTRIGVRTGGAGQ